MFITFFHASNVPLCRKSFSNPNVADDGGLYVVSVAVICRSPMMNAL